MSYGFSMTPYHADFEGEDKTAWIQISNILVHVWHEKFFRFLVSKWCKFILLDRDTTNRNNFEVAQILVQVHYNVKFPISVMVHAAGSSFTISASKLVMDEVEIDNKVQNAFKMTGSSSVSYESSGFMGEILVRESSPISDRLARANEALSPVDGISIEMVEEVDDDRLLAWGSQKFIEESDHACEEGAVGSEMLIHECDRGTSLEKEVVSPMQKVKPTNRQDDQFDKRDLLMNNGCYDSAIEPVVFRLGCVDFLCDLNVGRLGEAHDDVSGLVLNARFKDFMGPDLCENSRELGPNVCGPIENEFTNKNQISQLSPFGNEFEKVQQGMELGSNFVVEQLHLGGQRQSNADESQELNEWAMICVENSSEVRQNLVDAEKGVSVNGIQKEKSSFSNDSTEVRDCRRSRRSSGGKISIRNVSVMEGQKREKKKKTTSVVRKRRSVTKEVVEALMVADSSIGNLSERFVSDEDIAHRNSVIL
ncbi:Uncharacterized protein TCM_032877 [Theobroma cacao]|uniref:DUF4283 domain-containing protein n=1 Tax=Theobroma cacao TaxID=3641 RepID=A0A061FA93_THECC|nr:Uncharacterized protein TCM_032877 [Theobroma cacao]